MKKIFGQIGGMFAIILVIIALQPAKAQNNDFGGWQWYLTYTKTKPAINFESWIFTTESIREAFGLSYIIGYMDGVNNNDFYSYFYREEIIEKWYQKGQFDGYLDRFLYQRGQCISLQVLMSHYFGFFDYMMPYRAVRSWLSALSAPSFFNPIACLTNRNYRFYAYMRRMNNDGVLTEEPPRPTRSPNDYRNIGEHKNIPLSRLEEVPEYEPTDKPIRSSEDYRNIGAHRNITLNSLKKVPEYEATDKPTRSDDNFRNKEEHFTITSGTNLRPRLNQTNRNNNRKKNAVLHRAYQDWPELKRYVKSKGINNIRVIEQIKNKRASFDMENAMIEIAIPGRQFNNSYSRRFINSLNIELPEYENRRIRRTGTTRDYNRRDYDRKRTRSITHRNSASRVRSRTTVSSSTRNSNRTRSRQGSSTSRSPSERKE